MAIFDKILEWAPAIGRAIMRSKPARTLDEAGVETETLAKERAGTGAIPQGAKTVTREEAESNAAELLKGPRAQQQQQQPWQARDRRGSPPQRPDDELVIKPRAPPAAAQVDEARVSGPRLRKEDPKTQQPPRNWGLRSTALPLLVGTGAGGGLIELKYGPETMGSVYADMCSTPQDADVTLDRIRNRPAEGLTENRDGSPMSLFDYFGSGVDIAGNAIAGRLAFSAARFRTGFNDASTNEAAQFARRQEQLPPSQKITAHDYCLLKTHPVPISNPGGQVPPLSNVGGQVQSLSPANQKQRLEELRAEQALKDNQQCTAGKVWNSFSEKCVPKPTQ